MRWPVKVYGLGGGEAKKLGGWEASGISASHLMPNRMLKEVQYGSYFCLVSLSKLVSEDPEGNAEKLLPLFYGMQVRREAIFEPIIRGVHVACGVSLQPLNVQS